MYIPACVFLYSICVYVCVRESRGEGGRERKTEVMMIKYVPVTLSQYKSSLILWSQNHAKLSNHHMEIYPLNGFLQLKM